MDKKTNKLRDKTKETKTYQTTQMKHKQMNSVLK